MSKDPKVSIIIPCYNRGHIIEETLYSILAQTSKDWECIVIDDGSTDDTMTVLEKFASTDERIQFAYRPLNKPKGANACRNYGIDLAKGNYVIFLDSDDILASTCVENRLKQFEKNPEFDYLVFMMGTFNGKVYEEHFNPYFKEYKEILVKNFIRNDYPWNITGPIWKKKILKKIGGFDESFLRYQDVEFHLRVLFQNFTYKLFEATDCYYRKSEISRKKYSEEGLKRLILNSYQQLMEKVLETISKEQLKLYSNDFKYSYYRTINKYLDRKSKDQIDKTGIYIFSKLKISITERFIFSAYKVLNSNFKHKRGYFFINKLFGRYFKKYKYSK